MDMKSVLVCLVSLLAAANAFVPSPTSASQHRRAMQLHAEEVKAAPLISGEELEVMLQDLEIPLIVDAYATWW